MNMTSWQSSVSSLATNKFYVALLACAVMNLPALAWSADEVSSVSSKPRTTVAAGFGFQDNESSSITVKTYDAQSGEVLSADTYDLDIKDDGPSSNQPAARIFAGGVGLGRDGLSEFTLRAYDAASGRFLWEGRLNLGVGNNPEVAAYPVVAQIQPRAAVTKIANQTKPTAGQPYFVLRAVNPQTGQVVWADQFSTEAPQVRVERISRSIIGMVGTAPRDIDFRIKMPDAAGRRLLWEDKIVPPTETEADALESSEEAAGLLPGWSYPSFDSLKKKAI